MADDSTGTRGPAADWLVQGNAHMDRRAYSRACRAYETAARLANAAGDRYTLAVALGNLSTASLKQGRLDEARRHAETALPIAQALDPTIARTWVSIAKLEHRLAELSHFEGKLDEAHRHIDQALGIRLQLTQQFGVEMLPDTAASTTLLACIHEARGDLDQAHAYFERAVKARYTLAALHPEIHSIELAATLLQLATVCTRLGRDDESRRHTDEAHAIRQRAAEGFAATVH